MPQNIIARSIALGPVLQQMCLDPIVHRSTLSMVLGTTEAWYASCDNRFVMTVAQYQSGKQCNEARYFADAMFELFKRHGLYNTDCNNAELRREMTAKRAWVRSVLAVIPDVDSAQFVAMDLPEDFLPGAKMVCATYCTADGFVVSMTEIDTPDDDQRLTSEQLMDIIDGSVLQRSFSAILAERPEIAEDAKKATEKFVALMHVPAPTFNEVLGL